MSFNQINLSSAEINPFQLIGKDWFLVSSGTPNNYNTMTASWGSMGVMWNKNIFTTVIRPTRHTFKFIEENDLFTISFFNDNYKNALKFCGANSGRDCDKAAKTGLTPIFLDNAPTFEQAKLVFICKKLSRSPIDDASFLAPSISDFYKTDALHVAFTGEIITAYINS